MINTIIRTIFFYFFITFAYRIMGKREIAQLGIIDLIVSILIAELVAISIENYNNNIFLTIIPISILVLLELFLGYLSVKSRFINNLLEGKSSIIINNGKLIYHNLMSQRYTLDNLLLELRQQGIYSIDEVEYAFLETNGKLSIFKYDNKKHSIPLPLIIEGKIQDDTLREIHKDKKWLNDVLNKNELSLENIFYGIYKKSHLYIIKYH